MPLPPYIAAKRAPDAQDATDYQTVFARHAGAVAAPTASLHFDEPLLRALADKGVTFTEVTLHVGAGTFLPVKVDDVTTHRMHAEWGQVTPGAAAEINATKGAGGRIIPVGTTALRLIESATDDRGTIHPWTGPTDIFIYPGYRFPHHRCTDDQLSPAEIHADDAGLGLDGARPDPADLCPCGAERLSLLQLWRFLASHSLTGRLRAKRRIPTRPAPSRVLRLSEPIPFRRCPMIKVISTSWPLLAGGHASDGRQRHPGHAAWHPGGDRRVFHL